MARSREKFVKLAESRTQKVLDTLDLIANLSSKSNYVYDQNDVEQIFSAIKDKTREVEATFKLATTKKAKQQFEIRNK